MIAFFIFFLWIVLNNMNVEIINKGSEMSFNLSIKFRKLLYNFQYFDTNSHFRNRILKKLSSYHIQTCWVRPPLPVSQFRRWTSGYRNQCPSWTQTFGRPYPPPHNRTPPYKCSWCYSWWFHGSWTAANWQDILWS